MTDVWILSRIDNGDQVDYSVWKNEIDAAKHACALIQENIVDYYNLADQKYGMLDTATKFNELVINEKYVEAIEFHQKRQPNAGWFYNIHSEKLREASDAEPIVLTEIIQNAIAAFHKLKLRPIKEFIFIGIENLTK